RLEAWYNELDYSAHRKMAPSDSKRRIWSRIALQFPLASSGNSIMKYMAAAAMIALLAGAMWQLLFNGVAGKQHREVVVQKVLVPEGERINFMLPDGTE